jgi:hypothetical protein
MSLVIEPDGGDACWQDEDIPVAVACRVVWVGSRDENGRSLFRERPFAIGEACELEDAGGFGVLGVELGDEDLFGEADFAEEPDAVVVDVELVPGEAVARADGVSMVVVVPAFPAGEERDPPVVAGVVLGLEAALAPEVGRGVDQPGGVKAESDAEEGSPEDHADCAKDDVSCRCESCAEGELEKTADDQGDPVIFAEPDMDAVLGEVGGVTAEQSGLGVESAAGENPAGVSPPGAVVRSVGIAFVVGVLMVDAVGGDPEDGSALEREAAAHGDEVLDPLGSAVAAMGEQAMVGHADADVDGEEVGDDEGGEIFPGEEEEGGDGSDVEGAHGDGGDPVDAALLVLAAHAEVLLDLLGDFGDDRDDGGQLGCGSYGGFFDGAFFHSAKGSHVFGCPFYC